MPTERMREELRRRIPDLSDDEATRAMSSRESLLALLRERGAGGPEALQHFEEYMESGGSEVMPNADPPSHAGPADSTDNPGS